MDNIILIGMPGAGKSTLGVLLAKALGKDFIDTDLIIQKQEGKLIQDIINTRGLDGFLEIEQGVLKALTVTNHVIATGGSAVYSEKGMAALSKQGTVVYLNLSFIQLEKRLKNILTRGIVMRKGKQLADVYQERVPLYQKYAKITIHCDHLDTEQAVQAILRALNPLD